MRYFILADTFENITVGQICAFVVFLGTLIGGIVALKKVIKSVIEGAVKDNFQNIDRSLEDLKAQINDVDMNATKNFLVQFLADIEQGQPLDDIECERFWEQYGHYIKKGGNSYIHRKVDELTKKGKL